MNVAVTVAVEKSMKVSPKTNNKNYNISTANAAFKVKRIEEKKNNEK